MRRLLSALVLALALLPLGAAFAGPAKEFKAAGVNWALPDGWSFSPVSASEESDGFFAKAECSSASAEVWAYSKSTDGLSLAERVIDLTDDGGEGMGKVAATKVLDSTLSGVKGKVIVQLIKAQGGAEGHFRKYVMIANDRFYQLLMHCWHGAHTSVKDEINAVRAGFRLLKGAGAKDAPEMLDEVGGSASPHGKDGADGDDGADGKKGADGKDGKDGGSGGVHGGGDGPDGDWPANGPVREGKTVKLEPLNVSWTLPEDGPFEWTSAEDHMKPNETVVVRGRGVVEREKAEFEKNTPDRNVIQVQLQTRPASPGWKAIDWMRSGQAKKELLQEAKLIDEANTQRDKIEEGLRFGNIKGAFLKMEGKHRGAYRAVVILATVLRGRQYLAIFICDGYTDAWKSLNKSLGSLVKGINFPLTDEAVRGPLLIETVPDYAGQRGDAGDEEKNYTGPGYIFEKPKGMWHVKATNSMNRDLKFAGEGRSPDGKSYLYFEIRAVELNLRGIPNPDEEKFIEKRAQDWEAGAGQDIDLGSGKKLKMSKGKFGRAGGMTYKFTGHLGEEPVLEEGYVVKYKNWMLWIKMQYIGGDAKTAMKDLAKDVKKGMKFSK